MKRKTVWYRQGRDGGKPEVVDSAYVRLRLKGYYRNVPAAMRGASKRFPVSTDFALYYPE